MGVREKCGPLVALIPSRSRLPHDHAGASFLAAAGFSLLPLINYKSIFAAFAAGVAFLSSNASFSESIVVFVHDDINFYGSPSQFARLVCQQLSVPGVGAHTATVIDAVRW